MTVARIWFITSIVQLQAFLPFITAEGKEHKFIKRESCEIIFPPAATYANVRSSVGCSIRCLRKTTCSGYVFDKGDGCFLYDNEIKKERHCKEGSRNSSSRHFFMKKESEAGVVCENSGKKRSDNTCACVNDFVGPTCSTYMEDCSQAPDLGIRKSRKYWIKPRLAPKPFQVYCQVVNEYGLTIIMQHRTPSYSFNRSWAEYRDGFELDDENHWLGNQNIHYITASKKLMLAVQLEIIADRSRNTYQRYHVDFVMDSESDDFAVSYRYSVPPLTHKEIGACWPGTPIKFSTFDKDNDDSPQNCAALRGAGWWFYSSGCGPCNPTGPLGPRAIRRFGIEGEVFWTPTLRDLKIYSVSLILVDF